MKVTVVDYGLSNLLSIKRGLEFLGVEPFITSNDEEVLKAEKLILPGVGAFEDAMKGLKYFKLDEAIKKKVNQGIPLLGVCLGMQMLFEESEENGLYQGLSFVPGRVELIPDIDIDKNKQCVPHIGWEKIRPINQRKTFNSILLDDKLIEKEVYFIHSYEGKVKNSEHIIAVSEYGGRDICAVIGNNNVFGCQFHPEKSGEIGLKILENFINIE